MTRLSKLLETNDSHHFTCHRRTGSFMFASFMIRIGSPRRAFVKSKHRTNMATQNFGRNAAALFHVGLYLTTVGCNSRVVRFPETLSLFLRRRKCYTRDTRYPPHHPKEQ